MNPIDYTLWTSVTLSFQFLIMSAIFFALPFIIYLIVGATARARSSSGKIISQPMINFPNFFYAIIVYDLIGICIYIVTIIFPLWLMIPKIFE